MRRVMTLALLAITLPTAALANSIDFTATTGTFLSGAASTPLFTNPFTITINGTNGVSISLTTSTLTNCSTGSATCSFMGIVSVVRPGLPLFMSSVSGTFTRSGNTIDMLNGNLVSGGTVANGVLSFIDVAMTGNGSVHRGTATINVNVVPEPGTLGLLGTGLIGLAGMVRRRIRLAT